MPRRSPAWSRSLVGSGFAVAAVAAVLAACGPTVPATSCPMFPANNHWHASVTRAPVLANSASLITTVGATRGLKADFGAGLWEGGPIGIPYVVVAPGQPKVDVTFEYADESDPGGYPVPANPPIEGGPDGAGDRHILMVEPAEYRLYELYSAYPDGDGTWSAGSGAIWDLRSNAQRPLGWTSADAAGLAILPGLVRYDEVAAGKIEHAIRMTVPLSRRTYLWPASHYARSSIVNSATNWEAYASGLKTNKTQIVWPQAGGSWSSVVGVAFYDASSSGNLRSKLKLASTQSWVSGDIPRIAAGQLPIYAE